MAPVTLYLKLRGGLGGSGEKNRRALIPACLKTNYTFLHIKQTEYNLIYLLQVLHT